MQQEFKRLHIVHIIDTLSMGGAQKLLVTFAAAAHEHNIQTSVISLHQHEQKTFCLSKLQELGVNVRMFPARHLYDPKRLWEIVRWLRHEDIDVLHSHLIHANIIGPLAGRLAGVPVVSSLHNTYIKLGKHRRIKQYLETGILQYGSQRIITVGKSVAEANQNRLDAKSLITIPNAVEVSFPALSPEERMTLRAEMIGDPHRALIISVGLLSSQKNYADLLTAFAGVNSAHPSAALVIVGRGKLHDELSAQIEKLQLKESAFLLGQRNDVPRLLLASDLFVSSSLWEGLPVVILEAMAAGLPVVATSVGELPHVVSDDTGVLVPPRDPPALTGAICTLLDNPQQMRALGTAGREYILRYYNSDVWLTRLRSVYDEVCTLSSIHSFQQEKNL